jgi:putative SOS response-associated peptidase YedK
MCNRRAMVWKNTSDLEYYYTATYSGEVDGMTEGDGGWLPIYNVSGYEHRASPVITSRDPDKIQMFSWGLIPYQTRSLDDALQIRNSTLLCRHEDMYDTYSFEQLAKHGKRCLIPTSGYFEHRWLDDKGRIKIPYYLYLRSQPIFSIAGLYSKWTDPLSGKNYCTYAICTTTANDLVARIHNQGQRMPVILATKDSERRWLDTTTSRQEIFRLCQPIPSSMIGAHPVSRSITSKSFNVPDAIVPCKYAELQDKLAA